MQVKTLMKMRVVTIPADATLGQAREVMAVERVPALPVVRGAGLVGMFTDRDARRVAPSTVPALARYEWPLWLDRIPVADAMTREVVAIPPNASVSEAARLLASMDIGALPVVDGDALVGLISSSDVMAVLLDTVEQRSTGFGRILVPTDLDVLAGHAVSTGVSLAERHGAALTLLHVLGRGVRFRASAEGVPSDLLAQIAARRMEEAAIALRRQAPAVASIPIDVEVATGSPAAAIIRVAARIEADLIVIEASGRRRLAEAVICDAPCPVLAVKGSPVAAHARS
jgi:CBS domain-containing protein/nucleotide-binding universal stress UspA family protein